MKKQDKKNLAKKLREAEAIESSLTRLFGSLQPPFAASDRLQAKLDNQFHESQLTLNDTGPYSFEQAMQDAQQDTESDLLAAGLEEEPIEDDGADDETNDGKH